MEELKKRMEALAAEVKERMEGLIQQTDQVPPADKYEGYILYCGNGKCKIHKDGQWVDFTEISKANIYNEVREPYPEMVALPVFCASDIRPSTPTARRYPPGGGWTVYPPVYATVPIWVSKALFKLDGKWGRGYWSPPVQISEPVECFHITK